MHGLRSAVKILSKSAPSIKTANTIRDSNVPRGKTPDWYPRVITDSFIDGMDALQAVRERGAEIISRRLTSGYALTTSSAEVDKEFVGLGLNEDNQVHLSGERIPQWVAQVKQEARLKSQPVRVMPGCRY